MSKSTPSIAMVAGEASGDLQGAALASRLREMLPSVRIWGVGGRRMCEAGVQVLHDSSSWSAIGIAESLRLVPRLLLTQSRLVDRLKSDPPDLLVLIDFGAFNVRLARRVRQTGIKVLYYFPPGSWHRSNTYEKLQGLVDAVVTPFPWSAETLRQKGFRAEFFGHPVLDTAKPTLSRDDFCGRFGLDPSRPIAGLLPGSRAQEIRHNLPAMLSAAELLRQSMPDLQFAVPTAPRPDIDALERVRQAVPWVRLAPGMAHDVLAHSRAAVVCSGTATMEAAVLGCPMVIVYRGSRLTWLEYKLLGRGIKFIGMPNIIADARICPELLQDEASPSRIAQLMEALIRDTHDRATMLEALAKVRGTLGSPGAAERTAGVVLDLLGIAR